ncbi:MAG: dinitrogenase iron-molybdenum cofactor biosynthesis protein [Clostridiales Family XIII bacterium]|jgi:predicted Fe-Mo cluster-binding NifX family protein|nr:dinitrogenase iron-molybdenum cofactor biosynthesis protein [Clostridiales Family XIII bacterium]
MKHRIALATNDGLTVYKHFGQANEYLIVDIDGSGYESVERRTILPPCNEGAHTVSAFDAALAILNDCEAVFVGKIGPGASEYLAQHGIRSFEAPGVIDNILNKTIERKVLDRFGLAGG